jgi:hypothetical protein
MQKASFLPEQAIEEFQSIYLEKLGKRISFEIAKSKAENFIKLFEIVTKNENEKENGIHNHKK